MINLVALDTSTERAAIALATADGTVHVAPVSGRRHGRDLIPQLAALLTRAGVNVREIQLVGIGLGPGSYTGLRVGVMAAKTLAYVTGAALVGVDSLAAIARNAPTSWTSISVIADAQRGDLYVAEFSRQDPVAPIVERRSSQIERLTEWRERLMPGAFVLGPAFHSPRIRDLIPDELWPTMPVSHDPEGTGLVALVRDAWSSGRRDDLWTLEPNYLRKSAAEEKWAGR